jgi:hypothetical protein
VRSRLKTPWLPLGQLGQIGKIDNKIRRTIENGLSGCTGVERLHRMTVSIGDFTMYISDYGTLTGNISSLLEHEAVR